MGVAYFYCLCVLLLTPAILVGQESEGSFLDGIFGAAAPVQGEEREFIALYRGFVEEGENLVNFCSRGKPAVRYADAWSGDQAVRSVLATVQLIGLETIVGAIGGYARFFRFDDTEYANLVENLTGNFCSANLSAISLRALGELMVKKFEADGPGLPSMRRIPSLAETLGPLASEDESMRNEFRLSLELFKVFCSWGGLTTDLKLMPLVLKNPVWMAFVSRRMDGRRLVWSGEKLSFEEVAGEGVFCRDFICRRSGGSFHPSVGSIGIADDVNRLYCGFVRDSSLRSDHHDPAVRAVVGGWSADDPALMNSHMVALITGVPDALVRSRTFSGLRSAMVGGIEGFWKRWASFQGEHFDGYLSFEEFLTVELVDRDHYFRPYRSRFSVEFDVNMGLFDRLYQRVGKLAVEVDLEIPASSLGYLIRTRRNLLPDKIGELDALVGRLEELLKEPIAKASKKFPVALWKEGMERLVAEELLEQFALYRGILPSADSREKTEVLLRLHVSPFALSYVREKFLAQNRTK